MQSDDRLFATVGLTVLVLAATLAVVAGGGLRLPGFARAARTSTAAISHPPAAPPPVAVPATSAADLAAPAVVAAPAQAARAANPASAAAPPDAGVLLDVADAIAAGQVPAAWFDAVDGRSEVLVRRTADGRLVLAAGTFRRYRPLVAALRNLDPELVAELSHAGATRASSPSNDDRLAAAVDHLLATPEVAEPAEMVSRHRRWVFADPALAALTPVQQQLVLMGPEQAAVVRAVLTEIRDGLPAPEPESSFPATLPVLASAAPVANASGTAVSGAAP